MVPPPQISSLVINQVSVGVRAQVIPDQEIETIEQVQPEGTRALPPLSLLVSSSTTPSTSQDL